MTETTVGSSRQFKPSHSPHLLQTVQILTEIGLEVVGHDLLVLSSLDILLSVQEPLGDVVLKRVRDHSNELLDLVVRQLTGTTQ